MKTGLLVCALAAAFLAPLFSVSREPYTEAELEKCYYKVQIPQKFIPFASRDAVMCVRDNPNAGYIYGMLG